MHLAGREEDLFDSVLGRRIFGVVKFIWILYVDTIDGIDQIDEPFERCQRDCVDLDSEIGQHGRLHRFGAGLEFASICLGPEIVGAGDLVVAEPRDFHVEVARNAHRPHASSWKMQPGNDKDVGVFRVTRQLQPRRPGIQPAADHRKHFQIGRVDVVLRERAFDCKGRR